MRGLVTRARMSSGWQEVPAQAQEAHAQAQDAHGPAAGEAPDLGGMLAHHILDASEYELPIIGPVHLPQGWTFQLGGMTVDMSPTKHTALLMLAALITTVGMVVAARVVAARGTSRAPSGFANAIEAMVVFFRDDVCRDNIGPGYRRFTPFVLTLFFFILVMNLLGLLPWGGTATGNLSVTAALAVITFLVTEVSGFRALGWRGYMKTIFYTPPGMGGVGKYLLLCLMAPVELLSKFTKPFALAIRLFANMIAGHLLIFALLGLIFVFGHMTYLRWGVAGALFATVSAIMLLELLIAVIQAYIFAMLSAVFIGLMQHEH